MKNNIKAIYEALDKYSEEELMEAILDPDKMSELKDNIAKFLENTDQE